MDGLDRSSLMDRYAHTRSGARITPDKQSSVQSVHERVARPAAARRKWPPTGLRDTVVSSAERIRRVGHGFSRDRLGGSAVAPVVAATAGPR